MSVYGLEAARFLTREGRVARGIKQVVPIAAPAAGNDFTVTVPGGEQWQVYGGSALLTASATVITRSPVLVVTVDGALVWHVWSSTGAVAGNAMIYVFPGMDGPTVFGASNLRNILPLPYIMLPQGSTIATNTVNLQVGDTWTNINLWVARFYLPDQKLDEIAECEQQEYFAAMRKAGLTQGV